MDDDNNGSLTQREFFKACKDFKVGISEENVPTLFGKFDKNGDGTISYDELLASVRGEMSQSQSRAAKEVFEELADRCGGRLTSDYIKKIYDASRHTDVIQGKRTADNLLVEFMETFEAHHVLGGEGSNVPIEEWLDYFHCVAAVEEREDLFITNLKNTFGINASRPGKARAQGGEGA